jgi:hypothetical protein
MRGARLLLAVAIECPIWAGGGETAQGVTTDAAVWTEALTVGSVLLVRTDPSERC